MEQLDFDAYLQRLDRLQGQRVDVEVAVEAPGNLPDGFVEGRPVWGLAQIAGRLDRVRRSSRQDERWFVEIDTTEGGGSLLPLKTP